MTNSRAQKRRKQHLLALGLMSCAALTSGPALADDDVTVEGDGGASVSTKEVELPLDGVRYEVCTGDDEPDDCRRTELLTDGILSMTVKGAKTGSDYTVNYWPAQCEGAPGVAITRSNDDLSVVVTAAIKGVNNDAETTLINTGPISSRPATVWACVLDLPVAKPQAPTPSLPASGGSTPESGGSTPETGGSEGGQSSRPGSGSGTSTTAPTGGTLRTRLVVPRQGLTRVARRGLRVRARCSAACSLASRVIASGRTARRLGIGASSVTVGRAKSSLTAAGRRTLTMQLTRKARRGLRTQRRVTLTVQLVSADSDGRLTSVAKNVTLKR